MHQTHPANTYVCGYCGRPLRIRTAGASRTWLCVRCGVPNATMSPVSSTTTIDVEQVDANDSRRHYGFE